MNQSSSDTLAPRAASVRTLDDLRGPAGRLEALFAPGRPDAPYAAVVAHPHPLFGGTMHTKVVYHAAKTFQHAGLPVLRFNYRGVGTSEGKYDRGEGERQDLAAAIEWLKRETGLPILATGFSFGAWVTLRLCCAGGENAAASVRGIVAIGLPIQAGDRTYTYDFLPGCELPKLFVSGAADEFGAVPAVEAAVALATPPAQLVFVPGADHFFQGVPDGLKQMQAAIRAWLESNFGLHALEERPK
jgi:alpha/beta superfamily hydrolase